MSKERLLKILHELSWHLEGLYYDYAELLGSYEKEQI